MADEDLIVGVSADFSDLQREFKRGAELGKRFAREVALASAVGIEPPKINPAVFAAQGSLAGKAFAAGVASKVERERPFDAFAEQARTAGATISAAFAAAFTVREVVRMSDEFTNVHNRLRLVAGSAEAAADSYRDLFRVAQATRSDIGATVDLFTKLAQSTRDLGVSQADLRTATTTIAQSFAVSGSSAQEAAGAIRQLGQALASGVLRGDEFNTLSEQAPRLRDAIADAVGVSIGELRKMAEAGQLVTPLVFRGVLDAAPKIGREFQQLTPTIGQAFTTLNNAVTDYVGNVTTATGTSRLLATTIKGVGNNLDAVVTASAAVGVVMAARFAGAASAAIQLQVATASAAATARLAAGATSLLGAGVTALGGTVGVAVIALAGLAFAFQKHQAAAEAAGRATDEFRERIAKLKPTQVELDIEPARRRVAALEAQLRQLQGHVNATPAAPLIPAGRELSAAANPLQRYGDSVTSVQQALSRARDELRLLTDAQNRFNTASGKTGLTSAAVDEEVGQLAKLRQLGTLRAEDAKRVAELVRSARAELARIEAAPLTGDATAIARTRQRQIELKEQIESLTKTTKLEAKLKLETKQAERDLARFLHWATSTLSRPGLVTTPGGEMQHTQLLRLFHVEPFLQPLDLGVQRVRQGMHDIDDAMRRVAEAGARADLAKIVGDPAAIRASEQALRGVTFEARTTLAAILPIFEAISDPAQRQAALDAVRAKMREIGLVVPTIDRLDVRLRGVATGVRGVLQIADAFGQVDANVRRSLDGVSGLLTGLADARAALAEIRTTNPNAGVGSLFGSLAGISSLVGVVGGITSTITGLAGLLRTGPSAEGLAIQRRNNELLADLTLRLSGWNTSLGSMTAAITAVRGLDLGAIRGAGLIPGSNGELALRALNLQLAQTGTTFAQLSKLARDNGIELLDSQGRISAERLAQFAEILAATREAAMRWGSTLDALTDRQSFANQIRDFDVTDTSQQAMRRALQDAADVFRQVTSGVPALFDRIFGGIDLQTEAGRAALNARFNDIVAEELSVEFQQGRGWLADLLRQSGFADLSEFNKWLLSADGALDAFTKTTREATQALGNLPQAFKALVDAERFRATSPGLPSTLPATQPIVAVIPSGPTTAPATGRLGGGDTIININEPIVIQGADKTAEELFEDLNTVVKNKARAIGGVNHPQAMLGLVQV